MKMLIFLYMKMKAGLVVILIDLSLLKMINDAKLNRFSTLICYRLDRIARNVADFSSTYKNLRRK